MSDLNIEQEILTVGRVGILADFPKAELDDSLTVADAGELGLRPMLQKYKAREVINWKTERINNVVRYTLVVLTELTDIEGDDEFAQKTEMRYRVLDLVWAKVEGDEELQRVYRQRVFTTDGEGHDVQLGEDVFPMMNNKRMNEIPFCFVSVENMGAGVDLPPLLEMVEELSVKTRERIVNRFVGGESIALILEASPAFVEGCLRERIAELEDLLRSTVELLDDTDSLVLEQLVIDIACALPSEIIIPLSELDDPGKVQKMIDNAKPDSEGIEQ